MPEDKDLTKDGEPKAKTGPKVGSHHQRGKPIKFAKAGKEAVSALSGRVAELEEKAGVVKHPLNEYSYPDAQIPIAIRKKAKEQVMRLLGTKGMSVPMVGHGGGVLLVHDVGLEVVLIKHPLDRGSGSKNCTGMSFYEFFTKTGLKFES